MTTIPTQLFHYSRQPIKELIQDFYPNSYVYQSIFSKPSGLWISVEDYEDDENWKTWCESEKFCLGSLKHKYLIKLKKTASILHLSSSEQLIEFSLLYKCNDPLLFKRFAPDEDNPYIYMIDWESVAKEYDGIIIAPYNYECRLKNSTSWYYGWDCASGCIWNIDAIKSFKEQSQPEEIPKDLQLVDLVQSK